MSIDKNSHETIMQLIIKVLQLIKKDWKKS